MREGILLSNYSRSLSFSFSSLFFSIYLSLLFSPLIALYMPTFTMKVSTIVAEINTAAKAFENNTHGAREKLLDLCSSLTAKLETPSEMIQKVGWAEGSAPTRLAVAGGRMYTLQ